MTDIKKLAEISKDKWEWVWEGKRVGISYVPNLCTGTPRICKFYCV